jgi:hypothetical protein
VLTCNYIFTLFCNLIEYYPILNRLTTAVALARHLSSRIHQVLNFYTLTILHSFRDYNYKLHILITKYSTLFDDLPINRPVGPLFWLTRLVGLILVRHRVGGWGMFRSAGCRLRKRWNSRSVKGEWKVETFNLCGCTPKKVPNIRIVVRRYVVKRKKKKIDPKVS